jgi:hypothetical protein
MACTLAKFASIPTKFAPKRKFLEFAAPQWKNKLGEFSDPDVLSWINNLYQDKAFPTREAFNKAYDESLGAPGVSWRNKTMVLTKEAFDGAQTAAAKTLAKMKAALETGEKVIYVY